MEKLHNAAAASEGHAKYQIPRHLDYFEGSMYDAVKKVADRQPDSTALDFMGRSTSYSAMMRMIDRCAAALAELGIKENDKVTIALPNCPQAVYMLYAVNRVGVVATMVHPLSAEKEIEFYLNDSGSVAAVTLDQFCEKFLNIASSTSLKRLIVTGIGDALSVPKKIGYALTEGRKIKKTPDGGLVIRWKTFLMGGSPRSLPSRKSGDPAVILYSGGTTGISKGIVLTNKNFNALGQQVIAANPMFRPGDSMFAAMPVFHGFGLGVCIHTALSMGARSILIPKLTAETFARQFVKYRCEFIAGVPTLYEAMLRIGSFEGADLSFLKGVFAGGDSVSPELKKRFDKFLAAHNASIQIREGYGTTETVTACCLAPPDNGKENSIGLPFPDTYIKIVEPDTDRELPRGEEGEILLSGPTVMLEYLGRPEETARTLRVHPDGKTWVYTGDLGYMDEDGYIFFRGRAKRMIITGGYNVYPGQLENILDAHEKVKMSCVIGVPDRLLKQKVKAFVTLWPGVSPDKGTKRELIEYCKKYIAAYAVPCEIEFRDEMPKTLVGKVAYRQLEEEELKKYKK